MRLIGLLLGVVLTFGLTAYVTDKVMTADHKEMQATIGALTTSSVPSGAGTSTTSAGGSGAGGSPAPPPTTRTTIAPSPMSTARSVACATDATSIGAAEETYQALDSRYTDIAGLVSARLLESSSVPYTVVLGPGGATYRLQGTGACA